MAAMDLRIFNEWLHDAHLHHRCLTRLKCILQGKDKTVTYSVESLRKWWNAILRIFTIDDVKQCERMILEQRASHKHNKYVLTINGGKYRKTDDGYIYRTQIKNNRHYIINMTFQTTQTQLIALETLSTIYYANNTSNTTNNTSNTTNNTNSSSISMNCSLFINLVNVSRKNGFTLYFKTKNIIKSPIKIFVHATYLNYGIITIDLLRLKYFSIIRAYNVKYVDDRYDIADVITKEHQLSNRIRAMAKLPLDAHYHICDDPLYVYYKKHRINDDFKQAADLINNVVVERIDDFIDTKSRTPRKNISVPVNALFKNSVDTIIKHKAELNLPRILRDHDDEYNDRHEELHYRIHDSFLTQNMLFTIHRRSLLEYYEMRENIAMQTLLWCISHITKLTRSDPLFTRIWVEIIHTYLD